MVKEPFKVGELMVYGIQERTMGKAKGASRVYAPKSWTGKKVRILLMETPNEES